MSYLAQSKRIAYIDGRLRYKKDYPSAKTLAEDYFIYSGDKFSTKTFIRDIEWLRNQNAPIEYDPARKGFYYSDETFNLPLLRVTSDDLLSLLVIDRALSSYRNSPFYKRLKDVFNSLRRNLPDRISMLSSELAENFSIIPEHVTDIKGEVWLRVREALERNLSLEIKYQAPGKKKPANREIDPYHLIGYKGGWYLVSRSHSDDMIRTYALSRIKSCRVVKEEFKYPGDFRLEDYIDPYFGVFSSEKKVNIAIKFYSPISSLIRERFWHPGQKIEEVEDDGIILSYTSNQQSQTLYWVSQWGPDAEILEPEELRERAKIWFSKTKERYN